MQTSVSDTPAIAYEGMIADMMQAVDIVSRKAKGSVAPFIPFGKMLVSSSADQVDQVRLPAAAGDIVRGRLQGIAMAETSKQLTTAVSYAVYADGEMVNVVRKGRIWVICEQAITALDAGVFIRHTTPGGSPPLASLGSFRVDADTANATAVPAGVANWLSLCSAGGLALLEIALP